MLMCFLHIFSTTPYLVVGFFVFVLLWVFSLTSEYICGITYTELNANITFFLHIFSTTPYLIGVYFWFQPVLHNWCNKSRGMCYPVCGMVHIKEPLLLIGKSSPCGGSRFPFSLSEWSLTIYLTPYNHR